MHSIDGQKGKEKEKKPTLDNLPESVGVHPAVTIGTLIFTVEATDANAGDIITYTIQTAGVPFDINSASKWENFEIL